MAQTDQNVWADFAELRDYILNDKKQTINKLKFIIEGFNTEIPQHARQIGKYGKKQDLIDRLALQLDDWHTKRNLEAWTRARAIITEVRDVGQYMPKRGPLPPINIVNQPIAPSAPGNYATKPYPYTSTATALSYAYPNHAAPRPGQSSSSVASTKPAIQFARSPFFRVDQLVSTVVECMESISSMDRRSQAFTFSLTTEQSQKLASKSCVTSSHSLSLVSLSRRPRYQLRLFCTSSAFYQLNRPNNGICQIEFPPTCEVRVNGTLLTSNLKGLKKKPGTAPPADLGTSVRTTAGAQNKIDMVYVNSQQPVHKKFYLVAQLVEAFAVDTIVERIKKGKYRSKDEILRSMVQSAQNDDEIVAGPQKMSLKCPLTYLRIAVPSRSAKCPHPQCFDAYNWFSMMEQTTTWLCPVCERVLNVDDLIIDGYFDSILKATDEEVEDVMVEADGEWHTADNKVASDGWRKRHGTGPPRAAVAAVVPKYTRAPSSPPPVKLRRSDPEVFEILDSDEEVDATTPSVPPPTRRHSTSTRASSTVYSTSSKPSTSAAVIDLTLDSSDEEQEASPPPPRREKRKERTPPDESILSKRQRMDSVVAPARRSSPPARPNSNDTEASYTASSSRPAPRTSWSDQGAASDFPFAYAEPMFSIYGTGASRSSGQGGTNFGPLSSRRSSDAGRHW